ncbi:hypothetical protein SDJN03_19567, partial [Cucurbita argyrosperma subsp. sororia]
MRPPRSGLSQKLEPINPVSYTLKHVTGTGAAATAINGNKWRQRIQTSADGDSGADASLSLDSESDTDFIFCRFPGVCEEIKGIEMDLPFRDRVGKTNLPHRSELIPTFVSRKAVNGSNLPLGHFFRLEKAGKAIPGRSITEDRIRLKYERKLLDCCESEPAAGGSER